jgi:hypothetical protein
MGRRQRRLIYAQRLASKLESSMQIVKPVTYDAKIEICTANIWMVVRKHAPLKLKRLFSHRKSILVPPKGRVRSGEIAHCDAYIREYVNLNRNQSSTKSCRTYVWMVVRQHAPQKLKRLLFNRKSVLVPPKGSVRDSEIGHCGAWSKVRQPQPQSINHKITSHLCLDGCQAARAAETQAPSRPSREHLDTAQGQSTWRPDCSLWRL